MYDHPCPLTILTAPKLYGGCCYSKPLELLNLSVIMAARGETMMIFKIDKPTFPLITFIIYCGKRWKSRSSQRPLEESQKRPSSRKFLLIAQKMYECLVYNSFDVQVIR